jgi:catalase
VKTADGSSLEATATLENSSPVVFDALVLPDGDDGVALLASYGQTREFVTNQFRHGKTILALGASKALLDQAGIVATLASGEADPGILLASVDATGDSAVAFIAAAGKHRHPAREADLPRI